MTDLSLEQDGYLVEAQPEALASLAGHLVRLCHPAPDRTISPRVSSLLLCHASASLVMAPRSASDGSASADVGKTFSNRLRWTVKRRQALRHSAPIIQPVTAATTNPGPTPCPSDGVRSSRRTARLQVDLFSPAFCRHRSPSFSQFSLFHPADLALGIPNHQQHGAHLRHPVTGVALVPDRENLAAVALRSRR